MSLAVPSTPGPIKLSDLYKQGIHALQGKSLGSILNNWNTQLETNTQDFHRLAQQIIQSDLLLLENGYKIQKLNEEADAAEALQREIDSHLDYVDTQQNELSRLLDGYEKNITDLMNGVEFKDSFRITPADEERERAFTLSESLNEQINAVTTQLNSLVKDINQTKYGVEGTTSSPVQQIVKIINNHCSVISELRADAKSLEGRVKDVKFLVEQGETQVDRMDRQNEQY